MSLYTLFFMLGAAGMVIMAILGVAGGHGGARGNHAHGAAAHSHGHLGHAATHIALAGRGAGRIAGGRASGSRIGGATGARGAWKSALSNWLSPRVLFTLCLGLGATGLLLAPFIAKQPLRAALAVAGGLLLEKAVVAPLWELLSRFGSAPARTLESAVLEEAIALTAFDSQGCGLISITLEGHEMRALARLKPEDRTARVRSGDPLLVESVDAARGQCVVSRLV